jgi:hypothetical protein
MLDNGVAADGHDKRTAFWMKRLVKSSVANQLSLTSDQITVVRATRRISRILAPPHCLSKNVTDHGRCLT